MLMTSAKLVIMVVFIVLFSISGAAQLVVHEIMYNPGDCSDSFCEWLELVNVGSESVNLSAWVLCGDVLLPGFVNHSDAAILDDRGTVLTPGAYALLTDGGSGTDAYNHLPLQRAALSLHTGKSSLCGELTNSGGIINLSNGTTSIVVTYAADKADGNGHTLEWTGDQFLESFVVNGTPGFVNSVVGVAVGTSVLRVTEFLPDPLGTDDASAPLGEWVELYNPTSQPVDARGLVIYDSTSDNELYISDTTVRGVPIVAAQGYLVVYRHGDSDFSLNNDGYDEVRLFNASSSGRLLDRISYSGSAEGMSWSNISGGWMKTVPTPGALNVGRGICDWSIDVKPNTSLVRDGSEAAWDVIVQKNYGDGVILGAYGIVENSFGILREQYTPLRNETVSSRRTFHYSPNLKDDVVLVRFWLESGCADDIPENNVDEELIAVNSAYKQFAPLVQIVKVGGSRDNSFLWGDVIEVKLKIYSGNDTRESITVSIEDTRGRKITKSSRLTIPTSFINVSPTFTLPLPSNCDHTYPDGHYEITVDGFGIIDKQGIFVADTTCEKERVMRVPDLTLKDMPRMVQPDTPFEVLVDVHNDDQERDAKLSAYLFRGSHNYTARDAEIRVRLGKDESRTIRFPLLARGMESGEYKVKVRFQKEGRATPREITRDILVAAPPPATTFCEPLIKESILSNLSPVACERRSRGITVWDGKDRKARELAPYIMSVCLLLLVIVQSFWTRKS